jgi:hypothetical protein
MTTVVVLHNPVSPDDLDTLTQADEVAGALTELQYRVVKLGFSCDLPRLRRDLQHVESAFVFNLVESVAGDGGLIYFAEQYIDGREISVSLLANGADMPGVG